MKFMKLYLELKNKTNSSSLIKYFKIVDKIMHNVDINEVDELKIKEIYDKLNVLIYDKSTAVSNEKFMSLIAPYKAKKMNMRLCFKGGHSALYNATEQRQMPIASAKKFCYENNISFDEYFYINPNYQHYSAEVKQCVKNCIIRVFDYGVEQKLIERNVSRIKYHFFDSSVRADNVLYKEEVDLFINQVFKEKSKAMLIISIYILSYFDENFVVELKKKNINFDKKSVLVNDKEILLPDCLVKEIYYYSIDKADNDYLFGINGNKLRKSSIRKYIYEVRKKIKVDKITISLLCVYFKDFIDSIFRNCNSNIVSLSQALSLGIRDEEEYNEYLDFLKYNGGI